MRYYLKKKEIIASTREEEEQPRRLRNQEPQERFFPSLSRHHVQVEQQPAD